MSKTSRPNKPSKEEVDAANQMLEDVSAESPAPDDFTDIDPPGLDDSQEWHTEEDERDFTFVNFDNDGDSFTGRFVRFYAPGEYPTFNNEHSLIGMVNEDGESCLLPAYGHLWDFLESQTEAERSRRTYRFTRKRKVALKGSRTFLKFRRQYRG